MSTASTINYPTVPRGAERLRITPSPFPDDALMDQLIESLQAVWAKCPGEYRWPDGHAVVLGPMPDGEIGGIALSDDLSRMNE